MSLQLQPGKSKYAGNPNDPAFKLMPTEVEGEVDRGLCLHFYDKYWRVTHVRTGLRVIFAENKENALWGMEQLLDVCAFHFESTKELPDDTRKKLIKVGEAVKRELWIREDLEEEEL